MILHQLQQEQRQQEQISTRNSSVVISEEETDDDEDEDDDDDDDEDNADQDDEESEHESVIQSVREDVSVSIIDRSKSIQTDLSFHVHDTISFTKTDPNSKLITKNPSDRKIANVPGKKSK